MITEPKNRLTEIFGSGTVRILGELKFSVSRKTANRNFRFGYGLEFFWTEKPVNRFSVNRNSG